MKNYLVIPVICLLMGCATTTSARPDEPALKDVFKKDFYIGAAITRPADGNCETALIKKHCNTTTSENVLKWDSIHPAPDRYNFGPGDRYVEFGLSNKMFIIGHNLIWHYAVPDWVFKDEHGDPISREALLQRMHDHIFTVVGRYKGKI